MRSPLPFVMRTTGLTLDEAERQLVQGIRAERHCPASPMIFATFRRQAAQGNAKAQLALDVFVHQARHWIGAYFLQLNGADALVFTAGIGENRAGHSRGHLRESRSARHRARSGRRTIPTSAQEAVISAREFAREGHGDSDQRRTGRRARSKTISAKMQ